MSPQLVARSPAVARMGRLYRLYPKARKLPVAERKRLPRVTTVPCTMWWRCYTERYN